jgi:16S rRNA (guanine527-N7)-methyltransferase
MTYTPGQIGKLQVFLEELQRWNKRYGFVGRRTGEPELVVRHVLDSLSAWPLISALVAKKLADVRIADVRIADVGSGAGFPGVPLAVFLPHAHFTLVEPSAKKTAFLRNIAVLTSLKNVEVAELRLQELRGHFDLVVLRAFSPLVRELDPLRRVLKASGKIIAYKGKRSRVDAELAEADVDPALVRVEPIQVPFLEEERHLVIISLSSAGV